jgi:hypothetical protein
LDSVRLKGTDCKVRNIGNNSNDRVVRHRAKKFKENIKKKCYRTKR